MGLRQRKDPASPLKSKLEQDKLRGRGTEMAVTTGEAGSSRQQVSPVFPSRWPADGPQGVDPVQVLCLLLVGDTPLWHGHPHCRAGSVGHLPAAASCPPG